MRDKFSDLIEQGITKFDYTPISGNLPEQDPICRMYNNIYSIPSDTHMSCIEDYRIITGRLVNRPEWDCFLGAPAWKNVDFRTSGNWCVASFLYNHGLKGEKTTLNGDVVYKISEIPAIDSNMSVVNMENESYYTNKSKFPQPIAALTTTHDIYDIKKCFGKNIYEVVDNMNKSDLVKGNNWVVSENKIIGLRNNNVYIINVK